MYDGLFNLHEYIEEKKRITLPSSFPEKWYMPITEDNKEVANEWRSAICTYFTADILDSNHVLFSDFKLNARSDGSHYCHKHFFEDNKEDYKDYQQITTEEFIKNVYNPWKQGQKQETMKKINWEQAQEIIDIACHDWKEKLTEKWAKNIVLKKDIEVSDSSYRIMRKACTEEQNKVFDKIFGKEKEAIVLFYNDAYKGITNSSSNDLMSINSFNTIKLNDNFKWALKDNILTVSHRD